MSGSRAAEPKSTRSASTFVAIATAILQRLAQRFLLRNGSCCTKAMREFRPRGVPCPRRPKWRNWQTRRTQNPVPFGEWGFDSPLRHDQGMLARVWRSRFTWRASLGLTAAGCLTIFTAAGIQGTAGTVFALVFLVGWFVLFGKM